MKLGQFSSVAAKRGVRVMNLQYRARLAVTATTVVLAGLFSLALVHSASATMLTDGQGDTAPGVAPDVFSSLGTDLKSTGSGALSDGASYTDYVYKGNTYGASDLSYVFVINPGDSGPKITEASYSNFTGYDVDAGYCGGAGATCGLGQLSAPTGVGRSSDGSTVDFYFSPAITTSGNTDFLMIETDSTSYVKTADICLMGTGTSCSGGFDPAAPAPPIGVGLPAVLAVGGMLCGACLLERSKKRRSLGTAMPRAAA
jgi:hypothetical protein